MFLASLPLTPQEICRKHSLFKQNFGHHRHESLTRHNRPLYQALGTRWSLWVGQNTEGATSSLTIHHPWHTTIPLRLCPIEPDTALRCLIIFNSIVTKLPPFHKPRAASMPKETRRYSHQWRSIYEVSFLSKQKFCRVQRIDFQEDKYRPVSGSLAKSTTS